MDMMREEDYLKNENADLMLQNEKLKRTIEDRDKQIESQLLAKELAFRDGMIEGLKYAIRCNGVSGGEVN